MKEKIALVVLALLVVIVGAVVIYGRSLVRTGRERKALHRRRVEDFDREEMFKRPTGPFSCRLTGRETVVPCPDKEKATLTIQGDARVVEKIRAAMDDDSTVTLPDMEGK